MSEEPREGDVQEEATGERQPWEMPGRDILEPHESLKYIGKLFKGLAVAVTLLIMAEVIIGVSQDGVGALPILLLEVAQLVIMAGLLWGGGDIAYLIVETNHDVRASRVHLWQLNMMQKMEMHGRGVDVEPVDPDNPLG
ncbi:MAG: hypothetical protein KY453_05150 [Gemmatimonadetes bacterium]|nr:hypothetical protein [Gemmatimonadota bacterium]